MKTFPCERPGCSEYRSYSRRQFLGWTGGLLSAAAVPSWMPRVALGEQSTRDVVLSLFLRGGADGLSLCVPFFESEYYRLRPGLAVPAPDSGRPMRALDLDGRFGFPPAFEPLVDLYRDQALAVVHACGSHHPTRSHFEAMHFMEAGRPDRSLVTGWLGRHLQTTAPTIAGGVLRAVAIGHSLPLTLVGAPQSIAAPEPGQFGLRGAPADIRERRAILEELYGAADSVLADPAAIAFQTVDLLATIDFENYRPAGGAVYPQSELGEALRASAALIRADVGVEALSADAGGWDTHDEQGPLDGQLSGLMADLAAALAAFWNDLSAAGRRNVVVLVTSEFGRNVFENGSRGTDHGHGGVLLALGGGVRGGRVVAEWPGMAPAQLHEGQDLAVTIDYRDVVAEMLDKRLGNGDAARVFEDPGFVPRDRGVFA